CLSTEVCNEGACGCPEGQLLCEGVCVDLASDATNCGTCGTVCEAGKQCSRGLCLSSPCDGICENPRPVAPSEDGFRKEPLGTGSGCYEVRGYPPPGLEERRIVCWEFQGGRSLRVNGVDTPCVSDDGFELDEPRLDGYCVQVGAGGAEFAGFLFPTR